MSNVRIMFSPGAISPLGLANGQSATGIAGTVLDVSEAFASYAIANGWIAVGYSRASALPALSGPTTARPIKEGGDHTQPAPSQGGLNGNPIRAGTLYFDTTVNDLIIWDGANWRSPISGSIV